MSEKKKQGYANEWEKYGLRDDGYWKVDPRDFRDVPVDTLVPADVWTMLQQKIQQSKPDFLRTEQELHERNELERKIREMRHTQSGAALTSQEVELMRRNLQQRQLDKLLERDARVKKAFQEGVE